ncbi:Hypothetical_protein [Hexamita inflata]|uniref:Hypothetical_protein n=1 Tax=Hexamita inflata TaxID=28002 RepID=A0AA86Q8T0_9EUKA|nr:Hypothetical protein HINF_LOCUS40346 [Hexamita inflata]
MQNNFITDFQAFYQLQTEETLYYFGSQKQPSPSLILASNIIKTIFTTKINFEKMQQKRKLIQERLSSFIYLSKQLSNALTNVQLKLTNNLQHYFGVCELASQ